MISPCDPSSEAPDHATASALASLRKVHPDRSDDELGHALRQAVALTEPFGRGRLIGAALFLLERD
jgi:hypothetical protein